MTLPGVSSRGVTLWNPVSNSTTELQIIRPQNLDTVDAFGSGAKLCSQPGAESCCIRNLGFGCRVYFWVTKSVEC